MTYHYAARGDRATAIGNTHYKFDEDRTCSSEDMIAGRQTHTHTHTQTDALIAILRSPIGDGVTNSITTYTISYTVRNFNARSKADISQLNLPYRERKTRKQGEKKTK